MSNTWTHRPGEITEAVKTAIRGLVEACPGAAKILLTGEVAIRRLFANEIASLLYANKALGFELFVTTDRATIHMTRFEAKEIWALLPDGMLERLVAEESKHLRVPVPALSHFDYLESLFDSLDLWDTYVKARSASELAQVAYLNCLTVFRKPGYLGIHPATFFLLQLLSCWYHAGP